MALFIIFIAFNLGDIPFVGAVLTFLLLKSLLGFLGLGYSLVVVLGCSLAVTLSYVGPGDASLANTLVCGRASLFLSLSSLIHSFLFPLSFFRDI